MTRADYLASALADAFLAGAWERQGLLDRSARCMGRPWRWRRPLVRRVMASFPDTPLFADDLRAFIQSDGAVREACADPHNRPAVAHRFLPHPRSRPRWDLPRIDTAGDLAAWLGVTLQELAGLTGYSVRNPPMNGPRCNYHRRTIAKRCGAPRVLDIPKRRLKAAQRRVLHGLLDHAPAHDAAHGFVRGRSIHTHAACHVGRGVVVRIDLKDFFHSVHRGRVHAIFKALGYPTGVAAALAGLATFQGRLPQGAPTSPALANLAARRLDIRLTALAPCYTRYADDLTFSGDRPLVRLLPTIARIAAEEGFAVNHRKTRVMRRGVSQRVTGLVVNKRVNVSRRDFDVLKATLENCRRHGPESQNGGAVPDFQAHLRGRVAHVVHTNPVRGARLSALLDQIDFS